jgi:hypothetical protein
MAHEKEEVGILGRQDPINYQTNMFEIRAARFCKKVLALFTIQPAIMAAGQHKTDF